MATAAPEPSHILRAHSAPITSVSFSYDNELIYSGDSSGLVVVTSTRSLRPLATWPAHTDGILGVQEWGSQLITHARDNRMHVWTKIHDPSCIRVGGAATVQLGPPPELCYFMDVNALNYCRFSLLPTSPTQALIAFPNLVESSLADVWSLPSCERIHASVGSRGSAYSSDGRGKDQTGIIMSMHLFNLKTANSQEEALLHLLCGYENGSVALRYYTRVEKTKSVESAGWDTLWNVKLHVESVMAISLSPDAKFALSVSADHLIGRYEMKIDDDASASSPHIAHRTKHPGHGCVAIKADSRICAIGGWDGKVRIYASRTLKPLGTLAYHRLACQALAFANSPAPNQHDPSANDSDEEEELSSEEKEQRGRWLAAGGKDGRISIWPLMNFEKA